MKFLLCLWFLVMARLAGAQGGVSFSRIDWDVQSIDAATPELLAQKLTAPYKTDLEKVRAIFSWTARNIAYNTGILRGYRRTHTAWKQDEDDTLSEWKSGDEMTARKVLRRKVAVCEGYAKLFKTLCDYAGIRSEVISGYAKGYVEKADRFRTNHSWNAVLIDSSWRLLDVTWASGYINLANEFVQRTDEYYFLTPPERFATDHFPDDLRWTLLERPPSAREFQSSPYKCRAFIKYSLQLDSHPKGVIEAAPGDTVQIVLRINDLQKDRGISPDPFFDSTMLENSPASVFLQPELKGSEAVYRYVVGSAATEWIHLFYNGDVVLRYRVVMRKKT